MTAGRLTQGLVALALAGVSGLGLSGSALAQTAYPPSPAGTPATTAPTVTTTTGPAASIDMSTFPGGADIPTAVATEVVTCGGDACGPGDPITPSAPAGTFDAAPGATAEVGAASVYQFIMMTPITSSGAASATFAIPSNLSNGLHHTVFTATKNGAPSRYLVPFVVDGAADGAGATPAAAGDRGRALPRTGSEDLGALGLAGGALVLVGAGVLVAARRRRETEQFVAA